MLLQQKQQCHIYRQKPDPTVQADQHLGQLNYCFISGPQLEQYSQFIVKHEHRVVIKPKYSISLIDQYPSGTSTGIKNRNVSGFQTPGPVPDEQQDASTSAEAGERMKRTKIKSTKVFGPKWVTK